MPVSIPEPRRWIGVTYVPSETLLARDAGDAGDEAGAGGAGGARPLPRGAPHLLPAALQCGVVVEADARVGAILDALWPQLRALGIVDGDGDGPATSDSAAASAQSAGRARMPAAQRARYSVVLVHADEEERRGRASHAGVGPEGGRRALGAKVAHHDELLASVFPTWRSAAWDVFVYQRRALTPPRGATRRGVRRSSRIKRRRAPATPAAEAPRRTLPLLYRFAAPAARAGAAPGAEGRAQSEAEEEAWVECGGAPGLVELPPAAACTRAALRQLALAEAARVLGLPPAPPPPGAPHAAAQWVHRILLRRIRAGAAGAAPRRAAPRGVDDVVLFASAAGESGAAEAGGGAAQGEEAARLLPIEIGGTHPDGAWSLVVEWVRRGGSSDSFLERCAAPPVDVVPGANPPRASRLAAAPTRLEALLRNVYATPTILDAANRWACPRCERLQCAVRLRYLWTAPRVLAVHLKRFAFTVDGSNRPRCLKLRTAVAFPIESLDIAPLIAPERRRGTSASASNAQARAKGQAHDAPLLYDLVGAVLHKGRFEDGHYTAVCRVALAATAAGAREDEWVLYNDRRVTSIGRVGLEKLLAARPGEPYLLFYARRE